MRQPVRLGIVGAGAIVRARHAPGLARIPGVEIVAVANARAETARAFCREWAPGAEVAGDWREVARHPRVDAVLIGAGPFLHEPATLAALEAGKHVFCQARMSTDLASARRMLAAAEARPDLVTMLCPPPIG
ncbi:MAG: Gfo/Idh/MocA family oxidoreductase, partial [Terrimicrobiaceae bacterium]|nr:Gfo/Idh/MocA family oxidoreductase [Terrimicrobiaceae bacterium]